MNLISMSRLDGQMTRKEYDFILAIAKALNLTQTELDYCMKHSDELVIDAPQSEEDKIEYMKNLVSMVFSEGVIDKQKKSLAEYIFEKFGYKGEEAFDFLYDELLEEAAEEDDDEEDQNPQRCVGGYEKKCRMFHKE